MASTYLSARSWALTPVVFACKGGYSQTFAAERSGIDRSALNKFEVGKFNPSLEWLCKLADGLDVPVVEFFSGLEDARPSECAAVLMTDAGE